MTQQWKRQATDGYRGGHTRIVTTNYTKKIVEHKYPFKNNDNTQRHLHERCFCYILDMWRISYLHTSCNVYKSQVSNKNPLSFDRGFFN